MKPKHKKARLRDGEVGGLYFSPWIQTDLEPTSPLDHLISSPFFFLKTL